MGAYVSSMAIARSRVLPPAFRIACLCEPMPGTFSDPRSALLLRGLARAPKADREARMKVVAFML